MKNSRNKTCKIKKFARHRKKIIIKKEEKNNTKYEQSSDLQAEIKLILFAVNVGRTAAVKSRRVIKQR